MKFGFRRQKEEKQKVKQVATREDMDTEAIREAIKSATGVTVSTTPNVATGTVATPSSSAIAAPNPEIGEINPLEGGRQVGILILPATRDVMDFWTLYKSVQRSGIPNHVGIFNKVNGLWTEEQLPE